MSDANPASGPHTSSALRRPTQTPMARTRFASGALVADHGLLVLFMSRPDSHDPPNCFTDGNE